MVKMVSINTMWGQRSWRWWNTLTNAWKMGVRVHLAPLMWTCWCGRASTPAFYSVWLWTIEHHVGYGTWWESGEELSWGIWIFDCPPKAIWDTTHTSSRTLVCKPGGCSVLWKGCRFSVLENLGFLASYLISKLFSFNIYKVMVLMPTGWPRSLDKCMKTLD